MYKHNVEIVVSRYNEDLSWINEYPFNQFEYIVYNKGDNVNFEKTNVVEIINIENVGKNDHTYLYHIIKNYDKLSDIMVFLPGSINIDCKKKQAIEILNNIIKSNYKKAYFIGSYHNNLRDKYSNFKLEEWKNSEPQNFIKNSESKLQLAKIRPYGLWYKYFFGNTIAHWSTWWGIFSFDKRDIIQHPISRYKILIETINKHPIPEAAHYIERSWGAIFFPLLHTEKISDNIIR
jgi:hypothetical protein